MRSMFSRQLPLLLCLLSLCLIALGVLVMSPSVRNSALVLGVFQLAHPVADAVDATWHAPSKSDINNLTKAVDGEGIYDFIFDTSKTPDDLYGTYNWCNMPHVRTKEYKKPGREYKLQYVEVIHRHHKRTPYSSNAFPIESYHWDCDNSALHYYGEPSNSREAARVYRARFTSPISPFIPAGWIGSCQFPQITAEGLEDSWQHGADLYGVYRDLLGFLPARDTDWRAKVKYRATNNLITHQVAGMVVNGMWDTTQPVPLLVQAETVDSLEPQYTCRAGTSLFNRIKSDANPAWRDHLEQAKKLFVSLDDISGVPAGDSAFHPSFDHYYDNLSARQCHVGKPLPCKLVDGANSSLCVTQSLANAVYRLGQWEYSQIYRDSPDSLFASTATYGIWIAELAEHLRSVIDGSSETLYFHNLAHDGSLSRLLSILQIDKMVWPGMGAEVVFELYRKFESGTGNSEGAETVPKSEGITRSTGGEFFVRVLFGGQVLKSSNPSLGTMDMVPVATLLEYFDTLTGQRGQDVKMKCSSRAYQD